MAKVIFERMDNKMDETTENTPEFKLWVQKGVDEYNSGDYTIMTPEELKEWIKSQRTEHSSRNAVQR